MSEIWDNPYPTCQCLNACGHSGHDHLSYVPEYLEVVMRIRPKRVLEWGPGVNTYIALAAGATVEAVEHNKKWIPRLHTSRLTIHHIPLDDPEYAKPVDDMNAYDMYFIDSGHREACLTEVWLACPAHAVVLLHDAQRERYHESLRLFRYVKFINVGLAIAGKFDFVLHFPRA